jgi:two-component system, cell cycle response regulator
MRERILAVDDEPANLYLLENLLTEYEVATARNGEEMWACIGDFNPSVILLDIMMPGKDGFEIAGELAAHETYREIPVLFLSARREPVDVTRGFDLGAYDYIKKPFDGDELLARVRSALKKSSERIKLSMEVIIDAATGLYNRRYLSDFLERETGKARRGLEVYALAMIDIDFFKTVNDTHGHQCGDFVLREFSGLIKKSLRSYDMPIRYGGEEFLIIFPSTSRLEAVRVIERITKRNTEHEYHFGKERIVFTFTCGVADMTDISHSDDIFDVLIEKADARLYLGKNAGRNTIVSDDDGRL